RCRVRRGRRGDRCVSRGRLVRRPGRGRGGRPAAAFPQRAHRHPSGPAVPDLPGLTAAPYLTNETVFEVTELPPRMVCVGAGIVNCELAQAFRRLGSEVVLVGSGERLMPSEASAASELLARRLAAEGVRLRLGQRVTSVDGGRRRAVLGDGTELP